jgi:hypothetical protein
MLRLWGFLLVGAVAAMAGGCETSQQACANCGYTPGTLVGTLESAQCSERRSVETQRAWQRQPQPQYWNQTHCN